MNTLTIQLFQALHVSTPTIKTVDLGSPKARSLFAYLVLNHHKQIDRRRLAFIFWPRTTETAARRNLRQYLHRIRRALEPIDPQGKWFSTVGHYIQFQPPEGWFLDVVAFEKACHLPYVNLETAVALYTGELLEDIDDEWVEPERERLACLYRDSLLQLIEQKQAQQEFTTAIHYAQLYITAEPYVENGYLQLMKLHYQQGNRGRVKDSYDQLGERLKSGIGADPLPQTIVLYEQMMNGTYSITPPSSTLITISATVEETVTPNQAASQTPITLVGRAKQLNWLQAGWTQCQKAEGNFYLIMGESGIGKSRLVEEWLAAHHEPCFFFSGRGYEFESMIPYRPLAQALKEAAAEANLWQSFYPLPTWLSSLKTLLPDLEDYLPQGTKLPQPTRQHHIIEALGNFLLTLTRKKPVVIYLDNLHWADTPTWNFLGYLSQRIHKTRLFMMGTTRPEDMAPEQSRIVRELQRKQLVQIEQLPRLTKNETEALINQLLIVENPDPFFIHRIYEETEGNPFFIIETIRAVREAGGDWSSSVPTDETGRRPTFMIPLQVQAVIESRLDKLDEESRMALGVAAAIGRAFTFALLQEVCQFEPPTLLNAIDEWLERGLVRETREGYDFTHEKLSQVAYQQLSRARRQWVHYQIAEYLQSNSAFTPIDPAQLAHHYYLSHEPAQALPFLAQAGQRAMSVRSYAEAREFGLRAIGLLGRFPSVAKISQAERIDLNLQLAQAYAFSGSHEQALKILQETERSAEALGDGERLAHIFYRSAQIFWLRGQTQTAADYARRLLRHAEELGHAQLRLAALRMLGRVGVVLSWFDDAIAYLLRYIDLVETNPVAAELPVIYGYLAVAYARVGSWQRAIDTAQKGVELADASLPGERHIVAHMQAAFVYAELREWQAALDAAEPVRDAWQERGMTPHSFMLRAISGLCAVQLHAPQGLAVIQAALQWAQDVDQRVMVHVVQLYLAQAQYQQGEFVQALGTAEKAAETARSMGDLWAEGVALRLQAESAMKISQPDWHRIENNLLEATALLRKIRARPDLARAYLAMRKLYDRAGQIAWAVDCHFRATTIFDELGMADERRAAQGQPAGERTGAVVIPGLPLRGPNTGDAAVIF